MSNAKLLAIKPKCAVCGDTTSINVQLAWRRSRDQKLFDVCLLCAEADKVNEHSVDNFGPSPIQDWDEHAEWCQARADAGFPD